MTPDEWNHQLLELQRAVREAHAAVRAGMDPLPAERAYQALRAAERAVDDHYSVRTA